LNDNEAERTLKLTGDYQADFIEELYFKRFKKDRPVVVKSVERSVKERKRKHEERKRRKAEKEPNE